MSGPGWAEVSGREAFRHLFALLAAYATFWLTDALGDKRLSVHSGWSRVYPPGSSRAVKSNWTASECTTKTSQTSERGPAAE